MQQVQIRIIAKDTGDKGEEDISMYAVGTMEKNEYATIISYDETGEGMDGVKTQIGISENIVTLTRSGTVSSTMVFEEGVVNASRIATPYGEMDVLMTPTSVNTQIKEKELVCELQYDLVIGGEKINKSLLFKCSVFDDNILN